jgi:hypothetical protein
MTPRLQMWLALLSAIAALFSIPSNALKIWEFFQPTLKAALSKARQSWSKHRFLPAVSRWFVERNRLIILNVAPPGRFLKKLILAS